MIKDVVVKDLRTFADDRGFFREVIRPDFKVAQVSHSVKVTGMSSGWHVYGKMDEVFYVSRGVVRFVLYDTRIPEGVMVEHPRLNKTVREFYGESETANEYQEIILSEYSPRCVFAPARIAHGYTILQGPADIMVFDTMTYDEVIEDEGHIDPMYFGNHWMREIEPR